MPPKNLLDRPLALLCDGTVLANATHVFRHDGAPQELLTRAISTGRRIFIGVEFSDLETVEAVRHLDDAAAEIVATVYRERG